MAFVPMMRERSLLIEVFAHPLMEGTCLASLLGLGSMCGVRHRVYNADEKRNGKHIFKGHNNRPGCHIRGGRAGSENAGEAPALNASVVNALIDEWDVELRGETKTRPTKVTRVRNSYLVL